MRSLVAVADASSLAPGQCCAVEVRGRRLALFNIEGRFYGIDDRCPHRAGPLSQGHLEGFDLWCPMHAWNFDIRTGACKTNPERPVHSYPVEVRDGKLWVWMTDDA
jgi:nitrite reductase (NADH) small subunit